MSVTKIGAVAVVFFFGFAVPLASFASVCHSNRPGELEYKQLHGGGSDAPLKKGLAHSGTKKLARSILTVEENDKAATHATDLSGVKVFSQRIFWKSPMIVASTVHFAPKVSPHIFKSVLIL